MEGCRDDDTVLSLQKRVKAWTCASSCRTVFVLGKGNTSNTSGFSTTVYEWTSFNWKRKRNYYYNRKETARPRESHTVYQASTPYAQLGAQCRCNVYGYLA